MNNVKIKLFSSSNITAIEDKINNFLESHKVESIDFKMNDHVLMAIIKYYDLG